MDSWEEDAEDGAFGELLQAVAETKPDAPTVPAGTRIAEHYEVIETLGAGGMGVVFLAADTRLNRKVALKLHNLSGSKDAASRSLREATAMARLQHPNVVTVHDVGHASDDQLFIAMEYVDGVTLRSWLQENWQRGPDIIRAFIQAGQGLQAAHEAGLVHRDVKPDNILVGRDARIRVADFGLAKRQSDLPAASTDPFAMLPAHLEITQAGGFAGTPAYASPEQWNRQSLDARSDQFSFCAALYEALYGAAPFAAKNIDELLAQIESGPPEPAEVIDGTPKGVRKLLLRGLAAAPKDRHPDMQALIEGLQNELGRHRRNRTVVLAAAVGVLGVGATVISAKSPCEDETSLQQFWHAEKRTATQASLDRVLPGGAETQRILKAIDDYVRRWATEKRAACIARSAGTEPSNTQVQRVLCLDHRERTARALVDALEQTNVERARRALQSTVRLPLPELCSDHRYFVGLAPPPSNDADARKVKKLRETLSIIAANIDGGDFEVAALDATKASSTAHSLGNLPLIADASFQVGRLHEVLGEYDKARVALESSYFAAQKSGYDTAALEAASQLVYLLSFHMSENDAALEWGRHASALAERLGGAGPMRGRMLVNISTALEQKGEYAASIETSKRAVEELSKIHGKAHADIALALTRLGSAQAGGGDPKEAIHTLRQAVAVAEAVFGTEHRKLHRPLAELGQALSPLGEIEEAIEVQTRARDICRASFGAKHVNTGFAELNLGVALYYANRVSDAREHFERATEIVEGALGPEHRDTALCLSNLALAMESDFARAAEIHRRIIKIFEKQGPNAVDVGMANTNLAHTLIAMKNFDEAYQAAHRANEIGRANDASADYLTYSQHLKGKALVGLGRFAEAVEILTACVKAREDLGMSKALIAESRFALAQALLPSQPQRALQHARGALTSFESLGKDSTEAAAEVRRWLKAR